MKNKHLELLAEMLSKTELDFTQARIRDKYLKEVGIFFSEKEENRKKILESFGTINKDKNVYEFENNEVFKNALDELNKLSEEATSLAITLEIKEMIEKTNYKPKVGEMEIIDEILESRNV